MFVKFCFFILKKIEQGRKPTETAKAQINQESTPLRDIGQVGPPQIVDMFECYSAAEGWFMSKKIVWAQNQWKYILFIK